MTLLGNTRAVILRPYIVAFSTLVLAAAPRSDWQAQAAPAQTGRAQAVPMTRAQSVPARAASPQAKTLSKAQAAGLPRSEDDFVPEPFAVRQLPDLSEEQHRKIESIMEKNGMTALRAKMFAIAKAEGLPANPPRPGGPHRGQGPLNSKQEAQVIGSDLLAAMIDADSPEFSKPNAKQAQAKVELKALHKQMRAKWAVAWKQVKPILTASQLKELRKTQPLGGRPFASPPR